MEYQPLNATVPQLSRAQLDPLNSPVLQRELPGLATALDEQAIADNRQATSLIPAQLHHSNIEHG